MKWCGALPAWRHRKNGTGGSRTLTESLQDFHAAIYITVPEKAVKREPEIVTSQNRRFLSSRLTVSRPRLLSCGGGIRTRDRRFMRPPHKLSVLLRIVCVKARGGVEPRACPPGS